MDKEVWCDVKGFEGKYQVSNCGRIKSLNYNHTGKAKILRPVKTRNGYMQIGLVKNGERKWYKVHRLVLSAFSPVADMDELQVNHINEIKADNRLENLEWCTCKDNCNHGTRNDRSAENRSIPIVQLTLEGKLVKAWESSMEAKRIDGFNPGAINQCCKNKFNKEGNNIYKGYRWMYLSEFMDKYNGIID